jgi:protein-S-isoprenylcysteine O-methyltransferase Ste14
MKIHLIFLLFFLLNLAGLWLVNYRPTWHWYRWPGEFFLLLFPLLTVLFTQPIFQLDYFWWRVAGGPLLVVGFALLIWALLVFQRQGGGSEKLVTSGPYNFVRHPQYLGLIFIWVGWWWLWGGVYSFYFGMFFVALLWLQGWLEEKMLLVKKFPAEYADYCRDTGMFWLK